MKFSDHKDYQHQLSAKRVKSSTVFTQSRRRYIIVDNVSVDYYISQFVVKKQNHKNHPNFTRSIENNEEIEFRIIYISKVPVANFKGRSYDVTELDKCQYVRHLSYIVLRPRMSKAAHRAKPTAYKLVREKNNLVLIPKGREGPILLSTNRSRKSEYM